LKSIDRLAHKDSAFKTFVTQLVTKLASKVGQLDVIAYSQFFEIYGEAVTLQFLRSRAGLKTERVPEAREGRPDFRCELESGRAFHIEVKSLDAVGGEFRQREMMEDALDVKIDLEAQLNSGKGVALTTTEVAPYKGVGATAGYDWRSLITVVDTLRNKCRQAFKSSQFTLGPTFALALLDRLILPGGAHALAPYYYEPIHSGACISGVLWHASYGKIGTPIFRICEFEGKPTLEGHLASDGLFTDPHRAFRPWGLSRSTDIWNVGWPMASPPLANPRAGPVTSRRRYFELFATRKTTAAIASLMSFLIPIRDGVHMTSRPRWNVILTVSQTTYETIQREKFSSLSSRARQFSTTPEQNWAPQRWRQLCARIRRSTYADRTGQTDRGCVKTSARFHTGLFRSLLRGLRAFRVEKIAKNLALLDRLQNVAEFLHGLDQSATSKHPDGKASVFQGLRCVVFS
jgi:hypothetical protein